MNGQTRRRVILGSLTALIVASPLVAARELLVGSWSTHSIRRYDMTRKRAPASAKPFTVA